MDGTIDVESELEKGSTFIVTLPFKIMKKAEFSDWDNSGAKMNFSIQQRYLSLLSNVHEMSEESAATNSPEVYSKIILAEDNAINRKVILKLIESITGYTADFVSDGKELVKNFDIRRHRLVITDLNMPNMDGIEAAKELKRLYGNSVKIIILTGNSAVNVESLKGIVDGLLEKPCCKEDLRKCIDLYCKE
ncbi:predicted protein [Naegleria gruberi]|uniref:histidine kinase n=1 Tax=Naegleria gruberi TaxID=5762 RepID=D2VLN9_NAEGR|nr:uncharacterized protein NAEGRDRAFT_50586 [Naegleria gruberi]EFC42091.1 predicted protein [Naegleria gruberi]|eukprot:XP_002674835.1 predicted protein [Naegleria gruberi strain NEG-M]